MKNKRYEDLVLVNDKYLFVLESNPPELVVYAVENGGVYWKTNISDPESIANGYRVAPEPPSMYQMLDVQTQLNGTFISVTLSATYMLYASKSFMTFNFRVSKENIIPLPQPYSPDIHVYPKPVTVPNLNPALDRTSNQYPNFYPEELGFEAGFVLDKVASSL